MACLVFFVCFFNSPLPKNSLRKNKCQNAQQQMFFCRKTKNQSLISSLMGSTATYPSSPILESPQIAQITANLNGWWRAVDKNFPGRLPLQCILHLGLKLQYKLEGFLLLCNLIRPEAVRTLDVNLRHKAFGCVTRIRLKAPKSQWGCLQKL